MNEYTLRFRYEPSMELLEQVAQRMGEGFNPDAWIFIVKLDSDKIKVNKSRESELKAGKLNETDQNILVLLARTGTAMNPSELEAALGPIRQLPLIPLKVTLYPKSIVMEAAKGKEVEEPERVTIQDKPLEVEDLKDLAEIDILADVEELYTSDYGVIQQRDSSGRFGRVLAREKETRIDKMIAVGERVFRVTPNGQIRMPKGRMGPKLYAPKGDYSEAIRQRKDGSYWYRVKTGKKRARWRKYPI